ncbi:hypothetical protein BHM03_00045095 [Ensete ventricosum]|nr:hypothetical protein BHM03_00045095 [Ensete ventricosum]
MSPRARCLSIMERTPLPQPNQPREEPIDPRLHSLYLETGAYLPTPPKPALSALARNFLDPDTLFSDSTGSLKEQLRLVNQRLDDVRRTLKTKDKHAEGPLHSSPFVQEIQDAHIPSHFHLPMLEAYDGSSDPMKHVTSMRR